MPSTFLGLNTSYTGLVAANAGLNITSNNISNIETKGYSRQQVNQTAARAIRTFTSYGCVGAGVDILSAERVRDAFYDEKFWNNNSKLGEYDKKQYYAALIENYLQNTEGSNAQKGFTAIFSEMDAAMQSLSTYTGDTNYALSYIGKAGNLCEYFNLLYNNFQQMQTDINDEIKIKVEEINSLAQQIGSLNKEINVIEADGVSIANELRDKRDLLVDQLSKVVDVKIEERDIEDEGTGQIANVKHYVVKIAGGQVLVDGYDYRELKCVPRETYERVNQNDVDGLYDIIWTDTNDELGVYANSTRGELKGLFEMRDGNNDEAFHGKVVHVDAGTQTVKIQVTEDYLKDMSKCTIPLNNGCITVAGDDFIYEYWDYVEDADGNCYYTFHLSTDKELNPEKIGTDKASQYANVGEQVDYQGMAYYLEQMNEWIRDYASAYHGIYGQEGATNYYEADGNCEGNIFFTGKDLEGKQYQNFEVELDSKSFNSMQIGYYMLNGDNFEVLKALEEDPSLLATHTGPTDGVTKYNIIAQLKQMSVDVNMMQFRGCKAEDFLICLMGDSALNAGSANSFQGIYEDIAQTIDGNRISISGVDADEEAANMITFQTAYNLSSKMISVLCEVYDKLIQETGV